MNISFIYVFQTHFKGERENKHPTLYISSDVGTFVDFFPMKICIVFLKRCVKSHIIRKWPMFVATAWLHIEQKKAFRSGKKFA